VLPLFIKQVSEGKKMTLTNPEMTRFLLPLPIAIDLVLYALAFGEQGQVLVRKSPAATVANMAMGVSRLFGVPEEFDVIGTREGEKVHETLVTIEELMKAESLDSYYQIRTLEEIDYDKYFTKGSSVPVPQDAYTSANTEQLDVDGVCELLLSLDEVKNALAQNSN
jgi:UDP-N-acetylglucosamine 4,6-dehydratase